MSHDRLSVDVAGTRQKRKVIMSSIEENKVLRQFSLGLIPVIMPVFGFNLSVCSVVIQAYACEPSINLACYLISDNQTDMQTATILCTYDRRASFARYGLGNGFSGPSRPPSQILGGGGGDGGVLKKKIHLITVYHACLYYLC